MHPENASAELPNRRTEVVTPLLSYDPRAAANEGQTPASASASPRGGARRRLRNTIAGLSALGCVGALVVGTVIPATGAMSADAAIMGGHEQHMHTGGTLDTYDYLVSDSVASLEAAPEIEARLEVAGAATANVSLKDTKLRYPFDMEVPLTDPFGYRTEPVEQFHDAQDMAAGAGTPIRIIGDGVVSEAGWATDGCGFALSVEHKVDGQAVTSRYCHMQQDSHSWQVGDLVKSGDQAGAVGETGMAFGAHLHFVLRIDGKAIDPLPFVEAHGK